MIIRKKEIGAVELIIILNVVLFIPVLFAKYLGINLFFIPLMEHLSLRLYQQTGFFTFAKWQFITTMFIHGDISHLLLNMYGLYIFGKPLEKIIGKFQFVSFYLICGALANILSLVFFMVFKGQVILIGASGAIYAVILGFAVFYPFAQLYLFFAIPMKIKTAILMFTVIELGSQLAFSNGKVAHITHLLGFIFGFLYLLIVYRKNAIKILFFNHDTNYYN